MFFEDEPDEVPGMVDAIEAVANDLAAVGIDVAYAGSSDAAFVMHATARPKAWAYAQDPDRDNTRQVTAEMQRNEDQVDLGELRRELHGDDDA